MEETSLGGLAREIAAANGFADRIEVVRGLSTWVTLPEKADVVVTDQIGHFGIEAGIFEYVPDARRRLLKPDARTVPARMTWRCAPIESAEIREQIAFWDKPRAGFDFSPVRRPAGSSGFPTLLPETALLSRAETLASAPVDSLPETGLFSGDVICEITRDGMFDGIGGWFVAELAPGITFTNGPDSRERINRSQVVLPIAPTPVIAGDIVRMRIRFRPTSLMVDWKVVVSDPRGFERARCRRSTFEGLLIAPEDLVRKSRDARLTLSRLGRARKMTLELCDGSHTVQEIEARLRREFTDILSTDDEAAVFVADVLGTDAG